MAVSKNTFGNYKNQEILQYTLSNDNGMQVKIMNYGATITSITVRGKDGEIKEIACGFDTFESYFSETYKNNAPYFGCIVGRYSSQIKDAKFSLNGKNYKLADNCGNNNLHGGKEGFDKKVWDAEPIIKSTSSAIKMSLKSHSLEEGFPGNVDITVIFSLNNANELTISYTAVSDEDTPLSLTNHTYFNLSGFSESIENHIATVHTDKRLALDDTGAATGEIVNLQGKVDDLRTGKRIGDVHKAMNDGFEHFYVLGNQNEQLNPVASISSEDGGLTLDVSTTEPCMLLYTGKYTSDELARENGDKYGKYRAFCCETHRYPNGPNIKNSPKSITQAGETFKSTTVFKIS
ncbi:aldose epimerase family protein [Flavivirga rizhaonensis]|uniref:Aldose 1-epimerase n=1 Tax=Flavivirga rizhaonensis TaxID=2559571 RepID=A0A4S1DUT2_9FLAO|nr:aldose epimerase family protein [Flavivirga rizhaonensis]TGV01840.1 galactose mutarotase [Flavivirga rizhaonensis]